MFSLNTLSDFVGAVDCIPVFRLYQEIGSAVAGLLHWHYHYCNFFINMWPVVMQSTCVVSWENLYPVGSCLFACCYYLPSCGYSVV